MPPEPDPTPAPNANRDEVAVRAALYHGVNPSEIGPVARQHQKSRDFSWRYGTTAPDPLVAHFHNLSSLPDGAGRLARRAAMLDAHAPWYWESEAGTALLRLVGRTPPAP